MTKNSEANFLQRITRVTEAAKTQVRASSAQTVGYTETELDIALIRMRAEDSRPAKAATVLVKAESIAQLGTLTPVLVDNQRVLLDGLNRLKALNLLRLPLQDRRPFFLGLEGPHSEALLSRLKELPGPDELPDAVRSDRVPVRVHDFNAETEPDRAYEVEVAANAQTVQYTKKEMVAIAKRLLDHGYTARDGRPRAGEKKLRPYLENLLKLTPDQAKYLVSLVHNPGAYRKSPAEKAIKQGSRFIGQLKTLVVRSKGAQSSEWAKLLTDMEVLQARARALAEATSEPSREEE